jgi:precorrin-6A/cobalt-precorrin-6A reductase
MILLLGGTSESVFLGSRLAEQGYPILVSTATDIPLDIKEHPLITRRQGELREEDFMDLVRSQGIRAIVDATHPYAQKISVLAQKAAEAAAIPYFLWERPTVVPRDENFLFAKDHEEGAWLAFSFSEPVLLTTGSRNLEPYVRRSRQIQIPLWVRVLPQTNSLEACRLAGIQKDRILTGRGPFSFEENRGVIKKYSIGVLVTKDSGFSGGVLEKLEAARQEHCQVVVIERPQGQPEEGFRRIEDLLETLSQILL